MEFSLPYTINNNRGEELCFLRMEMEDGEEKLIVENKVAPGAGPVMHTHYKQDESLTVLQGKIGYEIQGQPAQYARVGETVVFKRGVAHRFWNAGEDELVCRGWIKPANSIIFFLTALFNAVKESGTERPEQFDGAYLIHRYRKEYDLPELPRFVKSVIIPATYGIGQLTGRYRKFRGAPKPIE